VRTPAMPLPTITSFIFFIVISPQHQDRGLKGEGRTPMR
jgi:hypothetical protein